VSNPYQLIEELAKELREKQDELDLVKSDLQDETNEANRLAEEVDQLQDNLGKAREDYADLHECCKAADARNADLQQEIDRLRKSERDQVEKFQRDGEVIQKLNEEITVLKINKQYLDDADKRNADLNKRVDCLMNELANTKDKLHAVSKNDHVVSTAMNYPLITADVLAFLNDPKNIGFNRDMRIILVKNMTSWDHNVCEAFVDAWLQFNKLST